MKLNESSADRILRVVLGVLLLVLYFTHVVSGGLGVVFIVLGAISLVTGVVGFCPLYALLKIKTTK
jgi:hypothetical protein